MVYAASYWPIDENEDICALGFNGTSPPSPPLPPIPHPSLPARPSTPSPPPSNPADSKALTEAKRATLFRELKACGRVGWVICSIAPEDISASMLRREPVSLNAMSHSAAEGLVRRVVEAGVNVRRVFVDTVGDPERYRQRLSRAFADRIEFIVEKKADATYPVVGAASICAKVTRDTDLDAWEFREPGMRAAVKGRFGSGYPGDEVTKTWLRDNIDPVFGWPSVVRFSWAPAKTLLDDSAAPCKFEADEEEDGAGGGGGVSASLTSLFAAGSRGVRRRPGALGDTFGSSSVKTF
jgi:ribonuclease H2 subunit A